MGRSLPSDIMKRHHQHSLRLLLLALLPACPPSAGAAWINEFHYDNLSGDVGEFVEVAGPAGLDLSGWSLWFYNGGNQQAYQSMALAGTLGDLASGFGVEAFFPSFSIQNGPDAMALVDASNLVVQFLAYEGSFVADDGPAAGLSPELLPVFETSSTPVGHSLQLTGTGDAYADFHWTGPRLASPGNFNEAQSFPAASIAPRARSVPEAGSSLALLAGVCAILPVLRRRSRRLGERSGRE